MWLKNESIIEIIEEEVKCIIPDAFCFSEGINPNTHSANYFLDKNKNLDIEDIIDRVGTILKANSREVYSVFRLSQLSTSFYFSSSFYNGVVSSNFKLTERDFSRFIKSVINDADHFISAPFSCEIDISNQKLDAVKLKFFTTKDQIVYQAMTLVIDVVKYHKLFKCGDMYDDIDSLFECELPSLLENYLFSESTSKSQITDYLYSDDYFEDSNERLNYCDELWDELMKSDSNLLFYASMLDSCKTSSYSKKDKNTWKQVIETNISEFSKVMEVYCAVRESCSKYYFPFSVIFSGAKVIINLEYSVNSTIDSFLKFREAFYIQR